MTVSQLDQAVIANYRGMTTAVEGLDRAQTKAVRSANRMNREIAAGARNTQAIKEQENQAGKLGDRFMAIGAAVGTVTAALHKGLQIADSYRQTLAGMSKEFGDFIEKGQRIASGGGDARYGYELTQEASEISTKYGGGASRDQLLAAVGGFRGIHKNATREQMRQMMKYAQIAYMGGETDMAQFGRMAGSFMAGGGMRVPEAANLAGLVGERGGEHSKKIIDKVQYLTALFGTEDIDKYSALLLSGAYGGRTGMSQVLSEVDQYVDKGGRGGQEMIDYVMSTMTDRQRAGYKRELAAVDDYQTHLARRAQDVSATNSRWIDRMTINRLVNEQEHERFTGDPMQYTIAEGAEKAWEQYKRSSPGSAAVIEATPGGVSLWKANFQRKTTREEVVAARRNTRQEVVDTLQTEKFIHEPDATHPLGTAQEIEATLDGDSLLKTIFQRKTTQEEIVASRRNTSQQIADNLQTEKFDHEPDATHPPGTSQEINDTLKRIERLLEITANQGIE